MTKHLTIAIIFLLLNSHVSFAQKTDEIKRLEEKRLRISKEIKQINALLQTNKKREKSVITLVEDINLKISVRENLIRITNQQANLLTRRINTNQKEITNLRDQLKQLKEDYAAMIVKSYKSKSEQSRVMFLLSSDNFKQAYKRLQYIKQYTEYQKQQGETIKLKTKELQELNVALLQQKEDKQKLIEENRVAKKQLDIEKKAQRELMASISKELNKYSAQMKQKQKEADKIDKEIDRLIRLAIAESNKKAGNTSSKKTFALTPAAKRLAASFEANKGKLPWPVQRGVVKVKFGKQPSPIDRTVPINSKGIRIATEKGAKVKAVFDGEVTAVIIIKNANPAIMIRHGNYFSIYKNLSKISVKKGDKVRTGQEIGEVFTNPSTGESLLWLRITKQYDNLNPSYWLSKR
ncbi:peptidoglycan DD-metalloendopeptidase family protein [Ichthyenterobacterium sp. W332]|uniref:Peptidoglycan DD-metalloendopeptidase family protein n=1 Tax=Microcosmobacter mediterraneus TaxID=3075607 RepID=A0ABU2YJ88_9FLAO|nr:peptidoglycan DD-metalloendopeptidase family protein [Ichthyenterobacterium sp. W332]MDT0558102.1 peptidoglycan DD-metalloendopeptidase family protein [Ichthyenterobacterium sp. W332]